MRAAILRAKRLVVDDVPVPEPGPGEVLVRTLACGICGSDLHAVAHAERFAETFRRPDGTAILDLGRDLVMGHEFCAEIVAHGPGTRRDLPAGTRVCSVPLIARPDGRQPLGYSNDHPGGFGQYMRLTEAYLLPVPDGLPSPQAALTEPMAVGVHAVNRARPAPGEVALVIGCGPVGLAVIAALRASARPETGSHEGAGVAAIVAADFSPHRRALAAALGADVTVDPAAEAPFDRWREAARGGGRSGVVFECVGVPGMLEGIVRAAPRRTRVVIVGVCMEPDTYSPMFASSKELTLHFSYAYSREEFAATLRAIAAGALAVAPMITGTVGLDGVAGAFAELASPGRHAKILVTP